MLGIYRQILNMVKKGKVTMVQISQALQNYAADPWVQGCDQRSRHHIRKFMTPEKIQQWQTPVKRAEAVKPLEPSIDMLKRMAEMAVQPKEIEAPPSVEPEPDEELGEL